MRERRDRNTEQHQERNSVNTELPKFIFHIFIYFTPEGMGEATDLIIMI